MNKSNVCVLSIDAGGTFLKAALVKSDGTIVEDSFIRISLDSNGSIGHIQTAYTQLAALGLSKAQECGLELSAVGVCIPGPFDYANGVSLMTHKYVSIKGIPMRLWLWEGAGNIPIHFLHDSHAFLLGALWNNSLCGFERVAGVIIGTGLGFASFIDGKIYANEHGGPGISIFSRPYRNGTSEEYVSRRAIISRYRALCGNTPEETDAVDIAKLAHEGQPEAAAVFSETGRYLAEIVHDILLENCFECLLLGGAISKSSSLFLPELRKGLSDLPALRHIAAAENIDLAPVLGTARAALFPEVDTVLL
ncbi:glucokinase [Anaerobacterium chartisolvens]|uniref:Glucokinase n=1 Tax=Anaerobacterium chartisolvens TaxID=1297424 RepID=A0A369ALB5_9FIRM|nr:ROK family protein [Anaerobacterium chartisolvens]RCX09971.1 glucokinase [Anaerobacterium chartisolvens]